MKAYHFLRADMTSGSGNEPAWEIGESRTIEGEISLCERGYHSSPSWYDALRYAPGTTACIVEISSKIIKDTDKQVSSTRKLIACKDAKRELVFWVCDCSERALKQAKVEDKRLWEAVRVARLYMDGKASEEEMEAAYNAVCAAYNAAYNAAYGACAAHAARAAYASFNAAHDAAYAAYAAHGTYAACNAAHGARAACNVARNVDHDDHAVEIKWQKRRLNWYMRKLFAGEK
jgi:hypothetical protein